jgi:crotonobetainyl-CoA:carnitine CoA-transferase CaiB-like acyl-CoA transferase
VLPLKGTKVLDITRLIPGGFCTYLLSSYGAEVVKVEEPPRGDYVREVPPLLDGVSLAHTMINRGKRSIAIDLKKTAGKAVLRKLIERSDVFLEGFRPHAVERLGFSYQEVKKLNPRIVYCSISSFGRDSRLSSMPAHDLNFQGMVGLLDPQKQRRPRVPSVQFGDYVSGMYAAIGILAALRERRTATFIDVPVVQSLMSLLMLPASAYFATGVPPEEGQSLILGSEPYYAVYRTSDGRYLAVAAIEARFWENLTRAIGLPRGVAGLRDGTERGRARLRGEMRRVFASRTQKEWSELLMGKDTCVTPVLRIDEALDSAWARESGAVGSLGVGSGRRTTRRAILNQPLRFSGRMVRAEAKGGEETGEEGKSKKEKDAPTMGQHTRPILRGLGYDSTGVERLFRSGAVA